MGKALGMLPALVVVVCWAIAILEGVIVQGGSKVSQLGNIRPFLMAKNDCPRDVR